MAMGAVEVEQHPAALGEHVQQLDARGLLVEGVSEDCGGRSVPVRAPDDLARPPLRRRALRVTAEIGGPDAPGAVDQRGKRPGALLGLGLAERHSRPAADDPAEDLLGRRQEHDVIRPGAALDRVPPLLLGRLGKPSQSRLAGQRQEKLLAPSVRLPVERHHAAPVLQQRQHGTRERPAPGQLPLVEHPRRLGALHANRRPQHQPRLERIRPEPAAAVGDELEAFPLQRERAVEARVARNGHQA
jgi:hypothetical protein